MFISQSMIDDLYKISSLDILDNSIYLNEQETIITPQNIPIIENTRLNKGIIDYEYIRYISESNSVSLEDSYSLICESSNLNTDDCCVSISEDEIIIDPNIINNFTNYIIRPIPNEGLIDTFIESCIENYITSENESYLDMMVNPEDYIFNEVEATTVQRPVVVNSGSNQTGKLYSQYTDKQVEDKIKELKPVVKNLIDEFIELRKDKISKEKAMDQIEIILGSANKDFDEKDNRQILKSLYNAKASLQTSNNMQRDRNKQIEEEAEQKKQKEKVKNNVVDTAQALDTMKKSSNKLESLKKQYMDLSMNGGYTNNERRSMTKLQAQKDLEREINKMEGKSIKEMESILQQKVDTANMWKERDQKRKNQPPKPLKGSNAEYIESRKKIGIGNVEAQYKRGSHIFTRITPKEHKRFSELIGKQIDSGKSYDDIQKTIQRIALKRAGFDMSKFVKNGKYQMDEDEFRKQADSDDSMEYKDRYGDDSGRDVIYARYMKELTGLVAEERKKRKDKEVKPQLPPTSGSGSGKGNGNTPARSGSSNSSILDNNNQDSNGSDNGNKGNDNQNNNSSSSNTTVNQHTSPSTPNNNQSTPGSNNKGGSSKNSSSGGGSYNGGGGSSISNKDNNKNISKGAQNPQDPSFLSKLKRTIVDKPKNFIASMAAKLRKAYKAWMQKAQEQNNSGNAGFFKRIAYKIMQAIDYLMRKLEKMKTN